MKKKKLKPCSKPATPRLVETPKPSTSLYAAPNKAASSEEKAVMQVHYLCCRYIICAAGTLSVMQVHYP